jgi:carbamoyltransferase
MLLVSEVADDKQIEMTDAQKALFGIEKLNTPRSLIPAVTHVDYSARIQTVHKNTNNKFYNLIDEFKKLTGVPLLVNTSFNIRGEPIVETPEDAFKCFMGTDLDILVIGNCILRKDQQIAVKPSNYLDQFGLD